MLKRLITGDYQPHLEDALAGEVRRFRECRPLSPLIIVVPTNLLALHLSRLLAAKLGGHAGLHFLTLLDLARRLAQKPLALKGLSAMPPMADHLLLRQAVHESGVGRVGSYFGRVAETDGFLRVFLEAVLDLKEGCLSPDDLLAGLREAKLGPVAGDKISEVIALWRAYEAKKASAGFYDRQDLMSEAADSARGNRWLAEARELLVYGFYDFNPLQMILLERCATVRDAAFFVPYKDEPAFEYARPTLEWLKSLGFSAPDASSGDEPLNADGAANGSALPPGLRNLRDGLFSAGIPHADEHDGVVVLSAPGEIRESKEICRELMRLAGLGEGEGTECDAGNPLGSDGTRVERCRNAPKYRLEALRLNEIGILLREPAAYAGHLAQGFAALGVEAFIAEGLPLERSRAARSLLLLMEIIDSDFARRQVMDFLTFAEIDFRSFLGSGIGQKRGQSDRADLASTDHGVNPALWDLLSKEAGIVKGMESWPKRLAALRKRRRPIDETQEPRGSETAQADRDRDHALKTLIKFMERLIARARSLPATGTPGRLAQETAALYGALISPSPGREEVIDAIQGLALLDACGQSLERSFFFWLIRGYLGLARSSLGSFHGEGPAVAGLMSARGLPFKVVVLPGLREGWFPKAARQDPVLLDGERARLNSAFVPAGVEGKLGLKAERNREERLLFRLAVGAASKHVLLTFPRLDPLTGAERIPSGFLLEAVGAVTGRHCEARSLDRLPLCCRVPLAQLFPDDGAFLDQNEFDLSAAAVAVEAGGFDALAYLNSKDSFFSNVIKAEGCRWGERRFTRYDGAMETSEVIASLRGKHAGRSGVAAPTSLETYASCPFVYFMRHILGIDPVEDPEEVLSMTPRDRGGLAHEILEKAYSEMLSSGEGPWPEWMLILRSKAAEVLGSYSSKSDFGLPLLWELEEQSLLDDLVSSVSQDLDELGGFSPWKLELAFGPGRTGGSEGPPTLPLGDGRTVFLSGKMDRVDRDRGAGKVKVIDYKTGRGVGFKNDSLRGGKTLQLPLYVLGARHLFGSDAEVDEAEYFFVSGPRRGSRVRFTAQALDRRKEDLAAVVRTIVRGVEAGLFIAHPGDACRYCDYTMACGSCRQLFDRKQMDPRIAEYLRMLEID